MHSSWERPRRESRRGERLLLKPMSGRSVIRRKTSLRGKSNRTQKGGCRCLPINETPEITSITSVQEVIRYLRQQDDVIVPQEDGEYLVNGRFRMRPDELVDRANRMRSRQGKPEFNSGSYSSGSAKPRQTNNHPLFWDKSGPDEPDACS